MRVKPILLLLFVAAGLLASAPMPRPANAQERGVRVAQTPPPDNVRYYALVIGNDDYAYLPKLKTAAADAAAVGALLRYKFGFLDVQILLNATRQQIVAALSAYRRELGADASLLVYYAGHGYNDREADKAYWLPVDASPGDVSNWIIADEITTGIRVIPARHVLVVSDSCYSGMLTRGLSASPLNPAEREQFLQKMSAGYSRTLMASGGDEPVADGGGGGHSVFAAALLRGLREMDRPRFTASELFNDYIVEPVAGRADQTPVYNPLRNSGHESGDFVFTRVKVDAGPAAATAVTPPAANVDSAQQELAFWNSIQNSSDAEDFKDYLTRYPNGLYAGIARRRITARGAEAKPAPTSTPSSTANVTNSAPARTFACLSDAKMKTALYDGFLRAYRGAAEQQKTAYEKGREYLSNFGGCVDGNDGKVAAFVQNWVTKYDAAVVNFNCIDAFNKKDYAGAFQNCQVILNQKPDDIYTVLLLARVGYANVTSPTPDKTLNADAARVARRAVELIESGSAPSKWDPFPNRDEALGFLHYSQGVYTVETDPAAAADAFIRAARSNSTFARESSTYTYLAAIYENNELKKLVADYTAAFPPNVAIPDEKKPQYDQMLTQIGRVDDRIIDAYARAAAALNNDPKADANRKAAVMGKLKTYYKARHENSEAGLQELISGVMGRPLMLPGQEPSP